jgi:hypothetical protein
VSWRVGGLYGARTRKTFRDRAGIPRFSPRQRVVQRVHERFTASAVCTLDRPERTSP